ncbi:MAG: holin [Clostridia bacterium]|nr:holin [Clostridia bacterium]
MKGIVETINIAMAAIGAFLGTVLGGWDGFLYALLAFIVLDYLTGIMVAIVEKKLCSEVGFRGIFKKVMILFMVAIAHIVDSQMIGNGSAVRTAVIFFYASNEGISILENASKLGLPIPEALQKVLAELCKEDEKK